jgi:sodium-dependent phosphate cotransporter
MGDDPPHDPSEPLPLLESPARPREHAAWLHFIYALIFLYFFLCAIKVMGTGLKMLGHSTDWLERSLAGDRNPIAALMGGVFVTALVQSSSFTTALIIALVAAGQIKLETAVFALMGANVGTSITNNLVSLGSVRIRRQFRRAYTAAMMHGFINLLTVGLLFPLEWISQSWFSNGRGFLTNFSMWFAGVLGLDPIERPHSPVKVISQPVVDAVGWLGDLLTTTPKAQGIAVAVVGLILLFTSLVFMVTNLKGAVLRRIEGLFSSILFRNDFLAGTVGVVSTVSVQSSSVTTSLMVPLVGAGAISLRRSFPFMLGCNLGTTITGVIAATATPVAPAVGVAICHVVFNVIAAGIWYPLRTVPMEMAASYSRLASRSKRYYALFLLVVYFVIPAFAFLLSEILLK